MFGRMCIKLQMQTQTGHEQIRAGIRTGYVQIFTGIQNDTFRYCVRLSYVQIRTGIRADTNWDTCRYELYLSRYGKNTYRSTYISTYKYVRKNAYINMSGTYSYVFNTHRIRTYKTADEVCSVSHYVYHNIDISMLVLWSQGKGRRGPICQHSNGSR